MKKQIWKTVELIFTGNELLNGNVLNTNSEWMAKTLTALGLQVRRMAVVEDNIQVIAETIRESLHRKPDYILTSGGLGPTYDDVTLEGAAKALEKPLQLDPIALKMVQERYALAEKAGLLKIKDVEQHMAKMATLPAGSLPLSNPVGAAPGIMITCRSTVLFILPGVPAEMKAIISHTVIPWIKTHVGSAYHVESVVYVSGLAESRLAPIIVEALSKVGDTWIKSCVKGSGKSEICISTTAASEGEAKRRVTDASKMITEKVISIGGIVKESKMAFEQGL